MLRRKKSGRNFRNSNKKGAKIFPFALFTRNGMKSQALLSAHSFYGFVASEGWFLLRLSFFPALEHGSDLPDEWSHLGLRNRMQTDLLNERRVL